jgi:hypothetical protein
MDPLNSSAISDGGSADLLRLLYSAVVSRLGAQARVVGVFNSILSYFRAGADAHGSVNGLDLLPASAFEDAVLDLLEDVDSPYLPPEAAATFADLFCGGGAEVDGAAFAAAVAWQPEPAMLEPVAVLRAAVAELSCTHPGYPARFRAQLAALRGGGGDGALLALSDARAALRALGLPVAVGEGEGGGAGAPHRAVDVRALHAHLRAGAGRAYNLRGAQLASFLEDLCGDVLARTQPETAAPPPPPPRSPLPRSPLLRSPLPRSPLPRSPAAAGGGGGGGGAQPRSPPAASAAAAAPPWAVSVAIGVGGAGGGEGGAPSLATVSVPVDAGGARGGADHALPGADARVRGDALGLLLPGGAPLALDCVCAAGAPVPPAAAAALRGDGFEPAPGAPLGAAAELWLRRARAHDARAGSTLALVTALAVTRAVSARLSVGGSGGSGRGAGAPPLQAPSTLLRALPAQRSALRAHAPPHPAAPAGRWVAAGAWEEPGGESAALWYWEVTLRVPLLPGEEERDRACPLTLATPHPPTHPPSDTDTDTDTGQTARNPNPKRPRRVPAVRHRRGRRR